MNAHLNDISCFTLRGVGPNTAARLKKCNILSIQDLLFHLPSRYEDRTRITPINQLRIGDRALIEGRIIKSEEKFGRRRSLLCHFSDETGVIALRFFYFNASQKAKLAQGSQLRCFGEVRGYGNILEIVHPEYRHVSEQHHLEVDDTLTPIYPTTEGLNQTLFRQLTAQALALLEQGGILEEHIPLSILANFKLIPLREALLYVHRPPKGAPVELLMNGTHEAQKRLAFEELLAHHLSLRSLHHKIKKQSAPVITFSKASHEKYIQQLPFALTQAQVRAVGEIVSDLQKPYPMLRMLQGDVGSGKTVVAALSALPVVESGYQVAIMAPTEILAEQHYQQFLRWFEPFGIRVETLVGSLKEKEKRNINENMQLGLSQIVIGTHALFQRTVAFKKLGLIIIDEQHRFGVEQRLALREKGMLAEDVPHQLIMTATPIPRTLAMTWYADLDHSILDELPPGRKPIKTIALSHTRRQEIVTRIHDRLNEKEQVYWVCTLIDESDALECQAAQNTVEELKNLLPQHKIALIHGRLSAEEKENIMQAFKSGAIQLLVATTVIEVGVDVPNASVMVIENAERLGLSQLHQLRGRVGRGTQESFCILLYKPPLSFHSKQRIEVMRTSTDGFVIAQKDLELRGAGEILGTQQAGDKSFRIANLSRDHELFASLEPMANQLLEHHAEAVPRLIQRWIKNSEAFFGTG